MLNGGENSDECRGSEINKGQKYWAASEVTTHFSPTVVPRLVINQFFKESVDRK